MKINKFFSEIICVLFFCLLIIFSMLPSSAYADEKEGTNNVYCPLCVHRDDDDPLYKKERQFYKKIHIIKSIFRNSIDEVALASAVLHRYSGVDVAYEKEYDDDFDEQNYIASWQNIFASKSSGDIGLTSEEKKQVEANEKIALLTTAAIVMIDSNHLGTYSDVCFKDALAGNSLVNNDGNSGIFGNFINMMVCGGEGAITDNPLEFISYFFNGDNILIAKTSEKNRRVNTEKVCKNGYVGGLYSGVSKIEDEKKKQTTKELYAQQIIDLANYYKKLYGSFEEEENNSCMVNISGSTGKYSTWKQFDEKWGSLSLGGSSSVAKSGCLVTSMAMQIARSGTKIGTLPSGYSEFNPGAFVTVLNDNNGFESGGNYDWGGFKTIAPNWEIVGFESLDVSNNSQLASAISSELSSGYGDGNYQKFLLLKIHHSASSQHWVAVNGVENGVITIIDPGGPSGTTLDDNYNNWVVDGYEIMYASDVPFGQIGTTNNNQCYGNSGEGDIQIPQQYGGGGFTVTTIDTINWAPGTGQKEIADKWKAAGAQYDNGIAVLDGRYLIACTPKFGKVGDEIDFYLEDGTMIPTIMMDEKRVTSSENSNEWGHDQGANVLEFEVKYSFYEQYTNPGTNGWFTQWAGKRVASATNLTNGGIPSTSSSSGGAYCKNGVAYNTNSGSKSGNYIAKIATKVAGTFSTAADGGEYHSTLIANPSGNPFEKIDDPRLYNYYDLFDKVIASYPGLDPKLVSDINTGMNNTAYASCSQAAAAIIRATVDPDFETQGCGDDTQLRYAENSEKWQRVGVVKAGESFDEKCSPGDLLITASGTGEACHAMIYVGNEIAKQTYSTTNGNMFEASQGYNYAKYPGITRHDSDFRDFYIYRPTGKGESVYLLQNFDYLLNS